MPTYEQLRNGDFGQGIPAKTDPQIIESAARSNPRATRWIGRLRIAGRIILIIDVAIGINNVVLAPPSQRPRVVIEEVSRVAGALAGGWAGAKAGAYIGKHVGPWGAAIGGIVGGLGGAVIGGIVGKKVGEKIADWVIEDYYPPDKTSLTWEETDDDFGNIVYY